MIIEDDLISAAIAQRRWPRAMGTVPTAWIGVVGRSAAVVGGVLNSESVLLSSSLAVATITGAAATKGKYRNS